MSTITEYTEVVVEGVTITIPRTQDHHHIQKYDGEVVEQEIEIGMLDGNKLVLTAAAEDMINAEVESDSDPADTDARVNELIATSAIQLTSSSSDDQNCKNYVIVNQDLTVSADTHTSGHSLVIKRPPARKLKGTSDGGDGKARPFKCELCGKLFTKPEVMKRHKRSHSMTKDFSCSFCDMSFHRRDCLTDHLRNHTGERPFQCTICNKKFTRGFVLLRHMRIHTDGEFKCSVCQKSFDRKDTFNDHVRNHTGEKPYKCRFCPKSFSRSFVLTKHEKNHALKKSKYDEYDSQTEAILVDDIEYEDGDEEDEDGNCTEILLPKDFTSGVVIEEPTIELEHEEELEIDEDHDKGDDHEVVLGEVYSILPDHTLQSEVLVSEPVNEEVVQTESITLTSSDGQVIRVISKEQYDRLLQVAKKNSKIVKCDTCNKTFTSESTYESHFEIPWEKGGCLKVH
jgi:uncharacterized Zn-finger protein